ncbi:hypothetical protein [Psychroserpens sp.]|uniref:hypothetical protein n=1 Tax=Psychroserpens sp. TaxID=2020870 RepID=UPI001B052D1E|nr:hypothetical protein [Psychroserpens sp.]MBO6607958.1 hypothetical protein [Psychroserpens sp.]MBO6654915.1 hypothetical protein [Psychroserpens sp.]MBO6683011.1 hypothetical protein [Psychroserpens sp.]MBO6751316.1 hypothetical protein [Psychroserpens sp.]MBO6916499.1 hypothetical protein [Psychroserpens sp.]
MTTITRYVVALILCFTFSNLSAQETAKDSIDPAASAYKKLKISKLEDSKKKIEEEERKYLKAEVESINDRLSKGQITTTEAETLKKEAARIRAANIEDRIAIVDREIELIKRNPYTDGTQSDAETYFGIVSDGEGTTKIGIAINSAKTKPRKYDKRTTSDFVFAIGFNNAIGDGQTIGDQYSFLGSGFVELGWAWKTRVFQETNAVRLKYGFSFQWNKLTPKDDQYFVQNGNTTTLEPFPGDLRESEFRITNLVVPVHFEFGPSKKLEKKNYFRYSTHDQFKIGIGGYAGFRIGTQQKLRYKEDGDRVKQKIRRNYNASPFVYGLSAYVGYGSIGIYAKYDLNPLFENQAFDQNNLSLGFRFDLD